MMKTTGIRMATPSFALTLVLAGGMASVQSTKPFPAVFELSSLLPANGGDGTSGFLLNGIDRSDQSGYSVSSAGDVNGDGIDDLIIGASGATPNGNQSQAGQSYVVFGNSTPATPCSADFTGDGALNFLDISAFLAALGAGDPLADFSGDGNFNFSDVSAFLNAYSAGCP